MLLTDLLTYCVNHNDQNSFDQYVQCTVKQQLFTLFNNLLDNIDLTSSTESFLFNAIVDLSSSKGIDTEAQLHLVTKIIAKAVTGSNEQYARKLLDIIYDKKQYYRIAEDDLSLSVILLVAAMKFNKKGFIESYLTDNNHGFNLDILFAYLSEEHKYHDSVISTMLKMGIYNSKLLAELEMLANNQQASF
ncbi:MAG: hypothetical protein AAF153_01945, partial [Pseudomonadota bacterium]